MQKNSRGGLTPVVWLLLLLTVLTANLLLGRVLKRTGEPEKKEGGAAEIFQKMTLEEKVGQVIIAYFTGPQFGGALDEQLGRLPFGGIIFFSSAGNIESPAQVARLTEQIQQAAMDRGMAPLFIAIDQEGGAVARLTEGVTLFPGNMALGAAGSEELARRT